MKEIIKGIIAEMREFIKNPTIGTKTESEVKLENYLKGCMKDYADRIEVVVAKMETTTSTCKDSLQVGNIAAMREALSDCLVLIPHLDRAFNPFMRNRLENAIAKARAALAEPPRNCDMPEVAEGKPIDLAEQAWRVFKRSHKDSYLDAYGLLRCIGWLLTEAKGEGNRQSSDGSRAWASTCWYCY